jgi:hypothetical protein
MFRGFVTVLGLLALLGSCETTYSEPPTRCDDWCRATQRAHCEEDWPHSCVGNCEFFGPRNFPGCTPQWDTLLACYQVAPDSMFRCVGDVSTPLEGVCESEESAYGRCTHPVLQSCFEACVAYFRACDQFELNPCTLACTDLPDSCLQAVPYFDCLTLHADGCDLATPDCDAPRQPLDECIAELVADGGS